MKNLIALFFAIPIFAVFTGCVYNYPQQPTAEYVTPSVYYLPDPPANPNWSQEKEERLQNSLKMAEENKKAIEQLQAKLKDAAASSISESELNSLRQERDRLRERRDFLIGEINGLLVERGNKPLPYTGNN